MKENHTTEILLESQHTPLSSDKKVALWKNIEADISTLPTPSPYVFTMVTKKTMTSIALALVLMFSLGGTAYASNDARPGDILFPVDQALEEIRLALVRNDDTRAQLQIAFAEERLNELRSILAERNNNQIATSTVATFEAEADVFTNTTIVTVEINDRKTTFETTAKTKSAVIDEIVRRYSVDRNLVEQNLDFEVEDRASRVSDINGSNDDDDRVNTSVALISKLIDDGDDDSRERFISELVQAFGARDDDEYRFEQDDDKIEFRNDDSRVRIREKDGETRIEIRSDDDDRNDEDSDSNDDDDDSNRSSFEAEADVFTNTTIVTVEINDRKTTFETTAKTKSAVIDEIVRRYSVDRNLVEQNLDFEVEDRASRVSDSDDDSNSNDDDDNSSDDSSSDDDSNDDSTDDSDERVKIEVRVEEGQAEVRMEYGNKRDEFTTTYTTRSALVAQLAARSGLTQSEIENNLDLEVKD